MKFFVPFNLLRIFAYLYDFIVNVFRYLNGPTNIKKLPQVKRQTPPSKKFFLMSLELKAKFISIQLRRVKFVGF